MLEPKRARRARGSSVYIYIYICIYIYIQVMILDWRVEFSKKIVLISLQRYDNEVDQPR